MPRTSYAKSTNILQNCINKMFVTNKVRSKCHLDLKLFTIYLYLVYLEKNPFSMLNVYSLHRNVYIYCQNETGLSGHKNGSLLVVFVQVEFLLQDVLL